MPPLVEAVVPMDLPVSRLLDQVLVVVQVAMARSLGGTCPVDLEVQGKVPLLVVWSAAVPQAAVLPVSASAVVLQALLVPALVLASPVLVLSLVSVETVVQHIPVEAVLSEVIGPDRGSGPTGNLTEHLLVVASSFSAVAVVSLVVLVQLLLREEMVFFLPVLLGQA